MAAVGDPEEPGECRAPPLPGAGGRGGGSGKEANPGTIVSEG